MWFLRLPILVLSCLLITYYALAQDLSDSKFQDLPLLEADLSTLYYASEFDNLQDVLMLGDHAIGIRYRNTNPYDIVLLDDKKLLRDSLRLVNLFLHPDDIKDHQFISIQSMYPISSTAFIVVHNFGSTHLRVEDRAIQVVEPRLSVNFPKLNGGTLFLPPYYFTWDLAKQRKRYYQQFKVFQEGNEDNIAEWQAESNASFTLLNSYWDYKNFLEVPNRDFFLRHFISKTQSGFLFNEPASNGYVLYKNGSVIPKILPVLDKRYSSWFVFYDQVKDVYFPVLLYDDKEYIIFRLDDHLGTIYPLARTKLKPRGFSDFKVYVREENKENPKKKYFEHHLIPLY